MSFFSFEKKVYDFTFLAKTSRDVLTYKACYFLIYENKGQSYYGECSYIEGLSRDRLQDYEKILAHICEALNNRQGQKIPLDLAYTHPSIQFGLETLITSISHQQPFCFKKSPWYYGQRAIQINGLIWMNDLDKMKEELASKIEQGFRCIKIKIGQHDFEKELEFLRWIRHTYENIALEIRLDANGAFSPDEALAKLETLSLYGIHSIEQPIKAGQMEEMKLICESSPIPIALDEELIYNFDNKEDLLAYIKPQYIILKPSILGGFVESELWVKTAEKLKIKFWATSALESPVGLSAIAQWVDSNDWQWVHGLGTGSIYQNATRSPLSLANGDELWYSPDTAWEFV